MCFHALNIKRLNCSSNILFYRNKLLKWWLVEMTWRFQSAFFCFIIFLYNKNSNLCEQCLLFEGRTNVGRHVCRFCILICHHLWIFLELIPCLVCLRESLLRNRCELKFLFFLCVVMITWFSFCGSCNVARQMPNVGSKARQETHHMNHTTQDQWCNTPHVTVQTTTLKTKV